MPYGAGEKTAARMRAAVRLRETPRGAQAQMSALVATPVDDVQRLALAPRAALNAYLLGDVLIDAGLPGQGAAVLSAFAATLA